MNFISKRYHEAIEWCKGRNWWIRLPLLLFFIYVFIRHLQDPLYKSIIGWLNLGTHELGHVIFMPFGQFLYFLGGSLTQCLVPVIGMINFYKQRDFFAIAICFGWLSTNIFEVATYVGDARAQSLPLVGFGMEPPIHDWNYLLGRFNLISQCQQIANILRLLAVVFMFMCLILGFIMLWQMFITRDQKKIGRI